MNIVDSSGRFEFFSRTPQFWFGLQIDYILEIAVDKLSNTLDNEIQEFEFNVH